MDSFSELFDLVSAYCKDRIAEVAYNLWIKDITPVRMDGDTAYLHVKAEFKKKIIEEKYMYLSLIHI